jgi:lipoate-protein ligase A
MLSPDRANSPAEQLALEEAMLETCEASDHPGFLHFWESPEYFVVLGYGKDLAREVRAEECAAARIPILRRCSGGGTVLQGPGCLNYTLVLPLEYSRELETIAGANRWIMERIRQALATTTGRDVHVRGCTDLVHAGRKFSGNAQRRKRRSLLFHGCFLIDFDLHWITRALAMPDQQPEYRAGRAHADFLANFPVDRARLIDRLRVEWPGLSTSFAPPVRDLARKLACEKYSTEEWSLRRHSPTTA